jgi:hypothetical protein
MVRSDFDERALMRCLRMGDSGEDAEAKPKRRL